MSWPKAPLVARFVYDTTGRVVGTRSGDSGTVGSAGWACTTYDGRGRIVVQYYPAHGTGAPARARVTVYADGGNPLAVRVGDYGSPATIPAPSTPSPCTPLARAPTIPTNAAPTVTETLTSSCRLRLALSGVAVCSLGFRLTPTARWPRG